MTYGIKKCGMEYVRMMFGMKISDANCLARCFTSAPNLTTVVLSSNLIDDDLLRMLMTVRCVAIVRAYVYTTIRLSMHQSVDNLLRSHVDFPRPNRRA